MRNELDDGFKAYIVKLIVEGDTEKALRELSNRYRIDPPRLKIGRVKGKSKALALYMPKNRTIFVQKGELYTNPFVILHEFYHHLRYLDLKHRGTEKNADRYAQGFIQSFLKVYGSKGREIG